jgi:FAD:protein FMN transferase
VRFPGAGFRREGLASLSAETKSQPLACAAAALLLLPALAACRSADPAGAPFITRARFLMGTVCTVSLPPQHAAAAGNAFDEIARIEELISTWRETSELSSLNAAAARGAVSPSPELFELLAAAAEWSRQTGGAFNPLVGPLIEAWRTRDEGALPGPASLARAREQAAPANLVVDRDRATVRLLGGARVEEGGFGKGYAIDRAVSLLRDAGVPYGVIDFGGQVTLFGLRRPVEVAVAHPEMRDEPFLSLLLASGSVSTSSGSEKTFEVGGRTFSHLIDPRSGEALPPRGSVTVVHEEALAADILSTALYILGPEEGIAWADTRQIAALFLVPTPRGFAVRPSRAFERDVPTKFTARGIE